MRRWCESFDVVLGSGTDPRPHYRCRRCGGLRWWSGGIKQIGPCIVPEAREGDTDGE